MTPSKTDQPILQICRCFVKNDAGQYLFIQRHHLSRYSSGLWEIPGGKSNPDEDLTRTLEREVLEETNLTVTVGEVVYEESHDVPDGPRVGQLYVGLFATGRVDGGELTLSREHTNHLWLGLDELDAIQDKLSAGVRRALEKLITIETP